MIEDIMQTENGSEVKSESAKLLELKKENEKKCLDVINKALEEYNCKFDVVTIVASK